MKKGRKNVDRLGAGSHDKDVKKKKSRKALVREADAAASAYIRRRDGRCLVCGTAQNLTCGHLFSRSHYSTRWDEINLYTQCTGCNLLHEHDPYPLLQIAIKMHGQEAVDALHSRFSRPSKFRNEDLDRTARLYEQKLEDIEGGGKG